MIELKTEIDEDVAECKVLKLLLQPLVENAIVHGIMEKKEMEGRILIKAYKTAEGLRIIIEDNGEGMSDEQIHSLMTADRSNDHYGIKNINERIQLLFGKEFGLQFQSSIGNGTIVTISLPLSF
jgi:two-component system sensor histidine kinase YesM